MLPPLRAAKLMVEADTRIRGASTTTLTAIVCGLLAATGDVTDKIASYMPALRVPVIICRVMVAGAVVPLSVLVSHPVPEV